MANSPTRALEPYLFLSGGTALRALSQEMAARHIVSIHLLTTFDSGGSSAALRQAFGMPAVGDIRNRLLALADPALTPEAVLSLCRYRLPDNTQEARRELNELAMGAHPVWDRIPEPFHHILQDCLAVFVERAPGSFNPRKASIGNLVLTGAYLENGRHLEAAIHLLGGVLHVWGRVIPISENSIHLGAHIADGNLVVGQHKFADAPTPIEDIFLTIYADEIACLDMDDPSCRPPACAAALKALDNARLICFPMGSFYSSVLTNLLPAGIGSSIARSNALKIYIPNSGHDGESWHMSIPRQVEKIVATGRLDAPDAGLQDFVRYILLDSVNGRYPKFEKDATCKELVEMGLTVLDAPVVLPEDPNRHNPNEILTVFQQLGSDQ